jgi:tagatose-1,6-bisphosphate aldolase non-catalytic subunit AgaZ/GatZ
MKEKRLKKEEAAAKRVAKKAAKAEAEAAKTDETEDTVEDDGSGVGLHLIGEEVPVETVTQLVLNEVVDTVVDTNTSSVTTKQEFQAARTELKKVVGTNTTPSSEHDLEEDLEEDQSGETQLFVYEGIEYNLDTEDNIVYDDEYAEIGTWDGTSIEFNNVANAKLHRVRKLALKND